MLTRNSRLATIIGYLAVALLALVLAATAFALALSLWPNQGCTSQICRDCNVSCSNQTGKIETIITDNGTLTGINGTLNISGLCGIETIIDPVSGNLTFTNLRDISPYVVGQDGCSEFTTPQDAYNQAVLDGKGGDLGPGATIIIKPGIYDFGDTLFPITQSGITFFGLPGEKVIFITNATTGGISVTITLDMVNVVMFTGITFGNINDPNGFILNVTSGQTILSNCACLNSNFRIILGGDGSTSLVLRNSILNTLPPDDFITGLGSDINILFENLNMFITQGAQGGHVINVPLGCNNITFFRSTVWLNYYDGLIAGPLSGSTTDNIIVLRYSFITQTIFPVSGFDNHLIIQNGKININLNFNQITLEGFILYQNVDSVTGEIHNILMTDNYFNTGNSTIRNDATIIGSNLVDIINNYIVVANVDDFIAIPTATAGDGLQVRLIATTLSTTASGPGGEYALGPEPAITANLIIGNSLHLNQADTANGFTVTNLVNL